MPIAFLSPTLVQGWGTFAPPARGSLSASSILFTPQLRGETMLKCPRKLQKSNGHILISQIYFINNFLFVFKADCERERAWFAKQERAQLI